MTQLAFPYRRAGIQAVICDSWMIEGESGRRDLPDHIEGWDYNTVLLLSRSVRVDLEAVRSQAGLSGDCPLELVVSSFSDHSWLRSCVSRERVTDESSEVQLLANLPGHELGGALRLRTALVLAEEPTSDSDSAFTATLPGSVLWSDEKRVRLQGDAPLFPISVVDFQRAGFPSRAGWMLEIHSDVHAALLGSVRLYLNAQNEAVLTAFANAESPLPQDARILSAVYADVAKVMAEHALNQEPILEAQTLDPDSLGFALQELLRRLFGREEPSAIRARRVDYPADFSAEVFSHVGVFDR